MVDTEKYLAIVKKNRQPYGFMKCDLYDLQYHHKKIVRLATVEFLSWVYDFGLKAKKSEFAKTMIDTTFQGYFDPRNMMQLLFY